MVPASALVVTVVVAVGGRAVVGLSGLELCSSIGVGEVALQTLWKAWDESIGAISDCWWVRRVVVLLSKPGGVLARVGPVAEVGRFVHVDP